MLACNKCGARFLIVQTGEPMVCGAELDRDEFCDGELCEMCKACGEIVDNCTCKQ